MIDPREIEKYYGRGIVVDTNILLLLVVGGVRRSLVSEYQRTQIYDESDYDILHRLLSKFNRVITTAHIITETSNLLGKLSGKNYARAQSVLGEFMLRSNESAATNTEIAGQDSMLEVGVTDCAIELVSRDLVILTEDYTLAGRLNKLGRNVMNFNHLRTIQWL